MKELKFILTTQAGTFTLADSPDGWDDSLVKWERSDKYWGCFRSWTIPLKFVRQGALEVRREFYTYGMAAEATIEIQKLNKLTMQYYTAYAGSLDFATFKDQDKTVEVSFIDSGFARYLKDNSGNEFSFNGYYHAGEGMRGWYIDIPGGGTNYYEGTTIKAIVKCLIDLMTGATVSQNVITFNNGKIYNGEILFRSDYLDNIEDSVIFSTGSEIAGGSNVFKTQWDDLWKSLESVFGLGMGIEIDPTTGKEIIRIEEISHFFGTYHNLDVGEVSSVMVSIDKKLSFGRVKIGYAPKEYEGSSQSTTHEPNGLTYWKVNNPVSSTEIDWESKYRADGQGILTIWENQDFDQSDDIFFIERDSSTGYIVTAPATEGANSFTCYNPSLTPRQNLIRHLDYLSSLRFELNDDLNGTSGDNWAGYIFVDGTHCLENIALDWGAIFLPMKFDIQAAYPADMLKQLSDDVKQMIQFWYKGQSYRGFVMSVDSKLYGRGEQKITLLASTSTLIRQLIR